MPANSVNAVLTIYFDGQFWIAFYERTEDGILSIARHVFGPEPSQPEIAELISGPRWSQLQFVSAGSAESGPLEPASNPKRRQREAAKQSRSNAPSTKSQEAWKAALEREKLESAAERREHRSREAEQLWAQRVAKRKAKRSGH